MSEVPKNSEILLTASSGSPTRARVASTECEIDKRKLSISWNSGECTDENWPLGRTERSRSKHKLATRRVVPRSLRNSMSSAIGPFTKDSEWPASKGISD